jgi:hypothetical protein
VFATGVALAATASIAGAVVVLIPRPSQSPAQLLPIEASPTSSATIVRPPASPGPSLSIDTSPAPPIPDAPAYLPTGATLKARSTLSPPGTAILSYQLAGEANVAQGTRGLLQVWITPDPDGTATFSSSIRTASNGYFARTVDGHPATLTVPISGVGGFSVQWKAGGRLLTVSMARNHTPQGLTGISVDELMRVADSIR